MLACLTVSTGEAADAEADGEKGQLQSMNQGCTVIVGVGRTHLVTLQESESEDRNTHAPLTPNPNTYPNPNPIWGFTALVDIKAETET